MVRARIRREERDVERRQPSGARRLVPASRSSRTVPFYDVGAAPVHTGRGAAAAVARSATPASERRGV